MIARNIDEELYKQFKAEAVRRGLKVSGALEEAMILWLQKIWLLMTLKQRKSI